MWCETGDRYIIHILYKGAPRAFPVIFLCVECSDLSYLFTHSVNGSKAHFPGAHISKIESCGWWNQTCNVSVTIKHKEAMSLQNVVLRFGH